MHEACWKYLLCRSGSQHADLRAVLGGYMGILAAGEKAISTTNRNFVGRMGPAPSLSVPGKSGSGRSQRHYRQNLKPGGSNKIKYSRFK